jgi:hypothetical protein
MPEHTTERAFNAYAKEILLARGIWKSDGHAAAERLQEYRTALITAAVTGKIGVRSSVATRPGKQVTSASP